MDRQPVQSKAIRSAGFDEASGTVEVEFVDGAIYQYFDVPLSEFSTMMGESSVGTYFSANIKNAYRYARI